MNINPIIVELLKKRGIESEADMEEFLSDKPQKTYDPFLLPNMEAGVDLILSEIEKGSKICICGDYDADGITSTALMLGLFSHLMKPENLDYHIPSRFEEGYGLNKDAIKDIYEKGFDLIITVDCGSVSYHEVEYAKSLGLKVVVTDHHNIADVMADCILINPKHPDSIYPFKDLSGCGVTFKVAQAIQQRAGLSKNVLTEALDLAAIGTVGDIMPLVDENRTITKFGMKVLNMGKREGLRMLMEGAGLKIGEIKSENISFVIVPHLNASGRIENASQTVELLSGRCSKERMTEIVDDILRKNVKRRQLQAELFESCVEELEKEPIADVIVVEADAKYEGIAGIVAGKIKEKFYRPAIIVTPTAENQFKGTGRCIEGVNLYQLLKTQENLFEKFGGHSGACGFSMKKENLSALRQGLQEEMKKISSQDEDVFKVKYPIDLTLEVSDLTTDLADQLELLAPFGNKNNRPLILCQKVSLYDEKYMGNNEQHVRFLAKDQSGSKIGCVLFGKAQEISFDEMRNFQGCLIGKLENQVWRGVKRLQFMTDEIQIDGEVG
jgi:single-stranded-DNA-specific exonuclease